jgi:hypothetical protein
LQTDLGALSAEAAASDIEALGSGVLGTVAQGLKAAAESGGAEAEVAEQALRKLFSLTRRAQGGAGA